MYINLFDPVSILGYGSLLCCDADLKFNNLDTVIIIIKVITACSEPKTEKHIEPNVGKLEPQFPHTLGEKY